MADRKVKTITEELCGHEFSSTTISRIVQRLDEELERFARRRLEEPYPYLILDARYEKVREDGAVRSAKIIHAEGEYVAAEKLAMAAELIQRQPIAIQLRYLQTLVEIGTEKNTTVVFPLPIDMISSVSKALQNASAPPSGLRP